MKNLKANFILSILNQVVSAIIPIVSIPYISRIFFANDIGIISFINANTLYFIHFGVAGLSTYSQLGVAKLRDKEEEMNQFCIECILTRFLTMSVSIIVFVVVYLIGGKADYKEYYLIQLIVLVGNMLDFSWICQGIEDFKSITVINVIVKILSLGCVFLFVNSREDLPIYFMINASATLVSNIIVLPFAIRNISLKGVMQLKIIRHLKGTVIYFLPTVASILISSVDKLMLGYYFLDKTESGYYEQAYNIVNAGIMIFVALNLSMRSRMSYLYGKRENELAIAIMSKSVNFVILSSIPICLGLILLADLIVPWFLGVEYVPVVELLQIMSVWIVIKALSNCVLEQLIVPQGGQVVATKIIWIGTVCNVLFNAIFIPREGARGAVLASLLSELVILVITIIITRDKIRWFITFSNSWKCYVSACFMSLVIIGVKRIINCNIFTKIFALFSCGVVVYMLSLYLLKDKGLIGLISDIKKKLMRTSGRKENSRGD